MNPQGGENMLSKSRIAIWLIVLAVSVACAPAATPTAAPPPPAAAPTQAVAPTTAPTAAPTQPAVAQKVKLTFWYALGGATGKVIEDMVASFNKANPDTQVEVIYQGSYADIAQKLTAAITAKTLPDVAQMGGAPTLAESGAIVPMTEFVSAAERADIYDGF
jgi:ABC-type glycerol-3-phosphate transport system substrate-binding protein